ALTVFFSASLGKRPLSPSILTIRTPGCSTIRMDTSSPGCSRARPRMSKPQTRLATVAGAKTRTKSFVCLFIIYVYGLVYTFYLLIYFPALTTSANTPAAVTSAPAPGPLTTKGLSLYRSVVKEITLSLPDKEKKG